MTGLIATRVDNGICIIELDDPLSRNALSADMRLALGDAIKDAEVRDDIDAAVIKGAGGHFCAGGDIRTMGTIATRAEGEARMRAVADTALAVARFSKPLVACVHGHAAGAGVGLALLADQIVAANDATFTFSFRRLALGPDWGLSHTLPQRVGAARARQWIMRGDAIGAVQALAHGLVDTTVTAVETEATAIAAARALSPAPRQTGNTAKLLLADIDTLNDALRREATLQAERFLSLEHKHAIAQFLHERKLGVKIPR